MTNPAEFDLSERLQVFEGWHSKENRFIHINNVKEFIRLLKEKIEHLSFEACAINSFKSMSEGIMQEGDLDMILKGSLKMEIDKLAGSQLTK